MHFKEKALPANNGLPIWGLFLGNVRNIERMLKMLAMTRDLEGRRIRPITAVEVVG
jgi:hypothetical protein